VLTRPVSRPGYDRLPVGTRADDLDRLAELAITVGANVQSGQILTILAETGHEPLVRAIATCAYQRGARFVDPLYFDPYVKRARIEHADGELEFIPSWHGERVLERGRQRCAHVTITGPIDPDVFDGLDPARLGRDQLPRTKEQGVVVGARTSNWTIVPFPTAGWAQQVHPELDAGAALDRLWEEVAHVCRLDTDDPTAAWRERLDATEAAAARLNEHHFDALHYEGPGTDFTVGLLPTSHWANAAFTTVDGISHLANIPTEEVFTSPDPERADGTVRATKPLVFSDGARVDGLRVRFEHGRAVAIDADSGAENLRARVATDEGGARLGELALVDREGRIGPLGTVFYDTLLDENAASHIALGAGFPFAVGEEDVDRVNQSAIHEDFMIGSPDVQVTGLTRTGERVAVMRDGAWQI
jgi:aminopeptidase